MRRALILIGVLLAVGCSSPIPATTPPQIQHTMGAIVRVDDNFFHAPEFTVRYPQGWRIVKLNPDIEPLRLAMISPDNTLYIIMDTQPIKPEDYPTEGAFTTQTTRPLAWGTLHIMGIAPPEVWSTFELTLEYVLATLVVYR